MTNLAQSIAPRSTDEPVTDQAAAQDDLKAILRALGLSDAARPYSPHEVVQGDVLPRIATLVDALEHALDFAEDRQDVTDGSYGIPEANTHMQLASMLREALGNAEGTR